MSEDKFNELRGALSTWLTQALDIKRPTESVDDCDLLALRDWIDYGCQGEAPEPEWTAGRLTPDEDVDGRILRLAKRHEATVTRVRELALTMKLENGQSWNSISGQRILNAIQGDQR